MFGPKHYVPILRWKQGERLALKALRTEDRERITPLIEIPRKMFEAPKDGKKQGLVPDPAEVLFKAVKDLLGAWHYAPFFIDLCHIDGQIPQIHGTKSPLAYVAEIARNLKLSLIPVTSQRRTSEYQMAVAQVAASDGRGACVRVTCEDLKPALAAELVLFLKKLHLQPATVDLLVDCQDFDPEKPDMRTLLNYIPELAHWRTLTVASGAFPEDLQKFEKGMHKIGRHDWLAWKQLMLSTDEGLRRKPSFSDYTVQYGRYVEPPDFCNPSASIRYTLPEHWLIMRGEGILNEGGPGFAQYPASATLLRESKDFYGPEFSYGDMYISSKSDGAETNGTPGTWIRAGINHHMTVVSRQIASLPDSLVVDGRRRANSRSLPQQPTRRKSIRGA